MAVIGSVSMGAVIHRVFYSVFFAITRMHPARVIAVAYLFIQTYIHAYTILPIVRIPALYDGLEAATLLICLVSSYRFDGNELALRRLLPENKIKPGGADPAVWQAAGEEGNRGGQWVMSDMHRSALRACFFLPMHFVSYTNGGIFRMLRVYEEAW